MAPVLGSIGDQVLDLFRVHDVVDGVLVGPYVVLVGDHMHSEGEDQRHQEEEDGVVGS